MLPRRATITIACLVGTILICGCRGMGGATVEPARIQQSQQLERQDASSQNTRTITIEVSPPAPASTGAGAPVRLPPAPSAPVQARPDTPDRREPPSPEKRRGGWIMDSVSWAPRVATIVTANMATGSAPGSAGGSSGAPPSDPDAPVRVQIGDRVITAPAGSTVSYNETTTDTQTGGNAKASASATAQSAGWSGVGDQVVGKLKAGLASFKLPGLPGSSGSSRGGSGGGGEFGADLSSMGAPESRGGVLMIVGALMLAAAGVVWWITRPTGTRIAIAVAIGGASMFALGLFADWAWTPWIVLALVLALVAAGVWWLRRRKLEDDDYDEELADVEADRLMKTETLAAIVEGVETAPGASAEVVKAQIKKAAEKRGQPMLVKRVVTDMKAQ